MCLLSYLLRQRVLIQLVSRYTEASHCPCCHSSLLFISSVTWEGATAKLHVLFKMQVLCEWESWHNHVSCLLPYSFPSTSYHPILLFLTTTEYYGDVSRALAEITPRFLPVIVRANLEIFGIYVYLGLFSPESSTAFINTEFPLLFYCPVPY